MALARWNDANRPTPRPGDAIFDTSHGWYHAMINGNSPTISLAGSEQISVIHMGPPLHREDKAVTIPGDQHWLGAFSDLENEKLESIHLEALRLIQLVTPLANKHTDYANYDFRLHGVVRSDPNTPGEITIRASCSSFLEHCYETQGVDLVQEESVPEVTSAGHLGEMVGEDERRVSFLIRLMRQEVSWPCRVLFPSYQMRAFEKNLNELPYMPQLSDHPYVQSVAEVPMPSPGTEEDADLE